MPYFYIALFWNIEQRTFLIRITCKKSGVAATLRYSLSTNQHRPRQMHTAVDPQSLQASHLHNPLRRTDSIFPQTQPGVPSVVFRCPITGGARAGCWRDRLCALRTRSRGCEMSRPGRLRYASLLSKTLSDPFRVYYSYDSLNHTTVANIDELQRSASSSTSSSSEAVSSPFRVTAAAAVAVGSIAWYYHLYGRDVYAMTPAEEG